MARTKPKTKKEIELINQLAKLRSDRKEPKNKATVDEIVHSKKTRSFCFFGEFIFACYSHYNHEIMENNYEVVKYTFDGNVAGKTDNFKISKIDTDGKYLYIYSYERISRMDIDFNLLIDYMLPSNGDIISCDNEQCKFYFIDEYFIVTMKKFRGNKNLIYNKVTGKFIKYFNSRFKILGVFNKCIITFEEDRHYLLLFRISDLAFRGIIALEPTYSEISIYTTTRYIYVGHMDQDYIFRYCPRYKEQINIFTHSSSQPECPLSKFPNEVLERIMSFSAIDLDFSFITTCKWIYDIWNWKIFDQFVGKKMKATVDVYSGVSSIVGVDDTIVINCGNLLWILENEEVIHVKNYAVTYNSRGLNCESKTLINEEGIILFSGESLQGEPALRLLNFGLKH